MTVFYLPLYNALVFLINMIPGRSAGLAVVALTVVIRAVLYPLSKKSIKTQILMKKIEPETQKIKEQIKDKQEQARAILALYKKNDINPFAGIFLVLIQLPILIALYQVFQSGLPAIKPEYLYGFIASPEVVSMSLFGIDLLQKSWLLAVITAITQYVQINLSLPKTTKPKESSFQGDLAHSMNLQMRYFFPIVMFFIAYASSVLAIYLTTSNLLMTAQELFVKRKMQKQFEMSSAK